MKAEQVKQAANGAEQDVKNDAKNEVTKAAIKKPQNYKKVNNELRIFTSEFNCFVPGYN